MTDQQPSSSFLLLNPGPVQNDQYRGDMELFAAHGLSKVADVVLSGNSKIQNYAAGLKHFNGLRKGNNMDLTPLADLYPSSIKPDFAPISTKNITLEPGNFSLTEAELGVNVDSRALLGEEEKPAPAVSAQQQQVSAGGAMPKPTKIKLKLK